MSRVSRYQDSLNRFIKNKSCVNQISGNVRISIYNILEESDNIIPLIMLSVFNNQIRKKNQTLHAYNMATGIELMVLLVKIQDNKYYYKRKYGKNAIKNIYSRLITLVNIALSEHVKYSNRIMSINNLSQSYNYITRLLNNKLFNLISNVDIKYLDTIKDSDIMEYKMKNNKDIHNLISNMNRTNEEDLFYFIEQKYGSVCQLAILLGWILGGGDRINYQKLDSIGIYLGYMIKISYDFKNMEDVLNLSQKNNNNYVLNYGIQKAFELFVNNKLKFIEECMKLDIYTTTIGEILGSIENIIDNFIDTIEPC